MGGSGVDGGTGWGRSPSTQLYGWKHHRSESCLFAPVSGIGGLVGKAS